MSPAEPQTGPGFPCLGSRFGPVFQRKGRCVDRGYPHSQRIACAILCQLVLEHLFLLPCKFAPARRPPSTFLPARSSQGSATSPRPFAASGLRRTRDPRYLRRIANGKGRRENAQHRGRRDAQGGRKIDPHSCANCASPHKKIAWLPMSEDSPPCGAPLPASRARFASFVRPV